MTTENQDALQADAPVVAGRRSLSFDGLLIGMVIGFGISLPFLLFSLRFLSQAIHVLLASLIIALFLCVFAALLLYIFRKKLVAILFRDVHGSIQGASNALLDAVNAWPDRSRVSTAVSHAARETLATVVWLVARRAILAVVLGLVGAVIAMTGTVFLLKQTQALEAQNAKLDEHTVLLQRQNEIAAAEGQWELLWQAHFAADSATRIESAITLALKGHELRGLALQGVSRNPRGYVDLAPNLWYPRTDVWALVPIRLNAAVEGNAVSTIPSDVLCKLDRSSFENLGLQFELGRVRWEISGNQFKACSVDLNVSHHNNLTACHRCSFEDTEVNIRSEERRLVNEIHGCRFTRSKLTSVGFAPTTIQDCRFRRSAISILETDLILDCQGDSLVIEYHGSSGPRSEPVRRVVTDEWWSVPEDERHGFRHCEFGSLVFVWDEHQMKDVERFLTSTIGADTLVAEVYFVNEAGTGPESILEVNTEASKLAAQWLERRGQE
jgi:hypothetical protein